MTVRHREGVMTTSRHPVIVGVDGSPAAFGAVRWAADEAVRLDRPLRVIHALETHDPDEEVADGHPLAIDAATEIRNWQPGLSVTAATWCGGPARVLVEQSRDAALVVVGSRGSGGFRSLLIGSVGAHLAAHAHCPVLVVHHAERWAGPEAALPRGEPVVVAVDGSPDAALGLGLGFAEAASRGVPLHAIRTWHEPEHRWSHPPAPARLAAAAERELLAELAPWRSAFPGVAVVPRVEHCPTVPLVLDAARDALMLVIGARGRGGFEGVRLGAVARQVLEHAERPVLVARRG
ncbi:universal stress protein [Dactylosporangium matsuzakiense]|uniref:Universal stress protein n=1 Tax=Dactylosporangium matsuzakiense TaxID=53360 RepID=A0A9W6KIK8_9ACTN|nr:universal stress protein [Dactylosporangium matsuzakiense]UWZ48236.1 universal stress protein [Dactylosporangium matsuzakiense]GLL01470.1 universal stress protein [Dactylosporangium matsuzakiense]